METQSGARTPLVDPFGRELEAWLRDAPATRTPYLSDLVVPPVTGPVQRPDTASGVVAAESVGAEQGAAEPASAELAAAAPAADDSAFRRPRDRARHAAACAPSFPEPPERLALRIEDLAVEVSAASGRTTIERIVILEDEVRRRDEDLARLAAWEATVAEHIDPEVEAARAFAHTVFADLLADAATESDRRDRAAARRAATGTVAVQRPAPAPAGSADAPALVAATDVTDAIDAPEPSTSEPVVAVRPVAGLPAVSPVSANTRPTPLIQPATGPTVIDRAAFAAALTAHAGVTASTPVVLPEVAQPETPAPARDDAAAVADVTSDAVAAERADRADRDGWWSRLVARILRAFGRR